MQRRLDKWCALGCPTEVIRITELVPPVFPAYTRFDPVLLSPNQLPNVHHQLWVQLHLGFRADRIVVTFRADQVNESFERERHRPQLERDLP
jgi:hypothetical protein